MAWRVGDRIVGEVEEGGTKRVVHGGWETEQREKSEEGRTKRVLHWGWEKEQREKLRKEGLSGWCMEGGRQNSGRSRGRKD